MDGIFRDQRGGVAIVGRDAGGGDGLAFFEAGGDGEVQIQQLLEEVGLGVEAVSDEDGGGEGGVGVFEGVLAGEFEGAVEGTETAFDVGEGLGADAADFARLDTAHYELYK